MRMHAWKPHVFGCEKLQKLSRIMINKMTDVTVLVTGVGGAAVGNQVLKALRLAERKYRLVAADANQENLRLAQGELAYVLPPASDPRYLDQIVEICRMEHVDAVVPGSAPEFKWSFRFPDNSLVLGIFFITPPPQST